MILNGVCVIWRGWIDLHRLDGMGYLEYDEERAQVTPAMAPNNGDVAIHLQIKPPLNCHRFQIEFVFSLMKYKVINKTFSSESHRYVEY